MLSKSQNILSFNEVEYLYLFFNQLQEGLIIVDTNDVIIFVNNQFCDLIKYSREELIGKSGFEVYYLEEDIEFMKKRNELRKQGLSEIYETRFKRKDGKIIYVQVNANPILDEDANIKGFMASCIDITDKKNEELKNKRLMQELLETKQLLEQSLVQKNKLIDELIETKQKLQISNEEKDKFFSIITHDLKNAFSGFINYIQLFSNDISSFTLQELKEILAHLKDSADSLYKLLENLLEWSKLKRNTIKFEPVEHNLNLIMNQIISILSVNAEIKNIKIINNIPDNINLFIDPRLYSTIIRNILQNSIKFTNKDGLITIDYLEDDSNQIVIIEDNGIGMDDYIKENLFNLNKKINREGTNGESSTGLGLVLCKEFIALHNGRIWVDSEINKGSKFYISVPKKQ
jgi:PAS domain S-box-containing protein